jgi:hypothetical protein
MDGSQVRAVAAERVDRLNGPGRPGQLSTVSISHSKSFLYGAFVWVRTL